MRQIERWAQATQIAETLSFFDLCPRFVEIPRPLLIGSHRDSVVFIEGVTTSGQVKRALVSVDEPFTPKLVKQHTLVFERRKEPVQALRFIHQQLPDGFPELCLLSHTGECSSKIARAHSIQKSLFKQHAKNGHVYQFEPFTGKRDVDRRLRAPDP